MREGHEEIESWCVCMWGGGYACSETDHILIMSPHLSLVFVLRPLVLRSLCRVPPHVLLSFLFLSLSFSLCFTSPHSPSHHTLTQSKHTRTHAHTFTRTYTPSHLHLHLPPPTHTHTRTPTRTLNTPTPRCDPLPGHSNGNCAQGATGSVERRNGGQPRGNEPNARQGACVRACVCGGWGRWRGWINDKCVVVIRDEVCGRQS
jgi:hypothetical protein